MDGKQEGTKASTRCSGCHTLEMSSINSCTIVAVLNITIAALSEGNFSLLSQD